SLLECACETCRLLPNCPVTSKTVSNRCVTTSYRRNLGPSLMYSWFALPALKYHPSPLLLTNRLFVGKSGPTFEMLSVLLSNLNSVGPEPPFCLLRPRKIHMSLA